MIIDTICAYSGHRIFVPIKKNKHVLKKLETEAFIQTDFRVDQVAANFQQFCPAWTLRTFLYH